MLVKKQIDALLAQEMDRKNFLRYSGTVILGVLGVTTVVGALLSGVRNQEARRIESTQKGRGSSYGSSAYGA